MRVCYIRLRDIRQELAANTAAHVRRLHQIVHILLVFEAEIERSFPPTTNLASKHAIADTANHFDAGLER